MKKIQLYVISLWLLFFLVAVKEFVFISWQLSFTFEGFLTFLKLNVIAITAISFSLLGLFFYARFEYFLKGATKLPKKITKIEDQSYEHLAFLTTYIIPFLRVKLEGKDLVVTILLLIIIGAIFIKTNLFYKNPTLRYANLAARLIVKDFTKFFETKDDFLTLSLGSRYDFFSRQI